MSHSAVYRASQGAPYARIRRSSHPSYSRVISRHLERALAMCQFSFARHELASDPDCVLHSKAKGKKALQKLTKEYPLSALPFRYLVRAQTSFGARTLPGKHPHDNSNFISHITASTLTSQLRSHVAQVPYPGIVTTHLPSQHFCDTHTHQSNILRSGFTLALKELRPRSLNRPIFSHHRRGSSSTRQPRRRQQMAER